MVGADPVVAPFLPNLPTFPRRVRPADDPVAYVRKIIYHEHIAAWRLRRRELNNYVKGGHALVEAGRDVAGDVVSRVALQAALAKLTPRQRAVIVLRFFEDLSERDTAAPAQTDGPAVPRPTEDCGVAIARLNRELTGRLATAIPDGTLTAVRPGHPVVDFEKDRDGAQPGGYGTAVTVTVGTARTTLGVEVRPIAYGSATQRKAACQESYAHVACSILPDGSVTTVLTDAHGGIQIIDERPDGTSVQINGSPPVTLAQATAIVTDPELTLFPVNRAA